MSWLDGAMTHVRARQFGPGLSRAIAVARDYVIIVSFVGLFLVLSFASHAFFSQTNLLNILDQTAPVGIAACGATLVIIGGNFDLSVGAIYALSGVTAALLANQTNSTFGFIVALLFGMAVGVVNGGLVTVLRINSFIATLASSLVINGLAVLITAGLLITVNSSSFTTLGLGAIGGIKYTIIVFAAFAIMTGFVLHRTTFGRAVFATGGNIEAARLSGIRVNFIRTATFAISGLSGALAGIIAASQVGTGQADVGSDLALNAIAAVVIGGTSILGGEGAIWRTVLGVLLLQLIQNGFNLLNVQPYYQSIFQGIIIVAAVALDALTRRR